MNELYVPRDSHLHRANASIKFTLTLAYLIFLGLTPSGAWVSYLIFWGLLFLPEIASKLRVGFFIKRAFLALPFILAALPLLFNGPPPLSEVHLPAGLVISISPSGLSRFSSLAVKSWISIQAAILLAATTKFPDLLAALRGLRLPALFVAVVSLMWRYLAIIIDEAQSMLRARASRSAHLPGARRSGGSIAWRAKAAGGMAGNLFLRSLERSDRVYAAMLSRGYNGDLPPVSAPTFGGKDIAAFCLGVLVMAGLWLVPQLIMR